MRAEEITVPARFLTTVAHLIVTLTIVYDLDNVAKYAVEDIDDLSSAKEMLGILVYTSLACFGIEVVGIFSGVSLFLPTISSFYVFLHFLGTLMVTLFLCLHWDIAWFTWFFVLFSLLPAFLEMIVAFGVMKLKLMEYS